MNFDNKTQSEISELILQGFQTEFNTTFRLLPKSFVRVLAKVVSGVYISLYKIIAWFLLQIFPDTASFETITVLGRNINPLAKWGDLVGVSERKSATAWNGTATVSVLGAGTLASGTQLKNSVNGKLYTVDENVVVAGTETTITFKATCAALGEVGNLAVGDEIEFVSPLGFLADKAAVLSTVSAGEEAESEESFRGRITARWATRPRGGALADYRIWAADVGGVQQTYIYGDENSAAGVLIYVCANKEKTGSRIASAAMLKAVGEACTYDPDTGEQNRKPITAVLDPAHDETYTNVKSISEVSFDVEITGYTGVVDVMKGELKTNLESYFAEREPFIRGLSNDAERLDKIEQNNILSAVNEIAIEYSASFGSAVLKKSGTSITAYTLTQGEMAKLDTLKVNGTIIV